MPIDIDSPIVRRVATFAFLIFIFGLLSPFFASLAWAGILAYVTWPLHQRLLHRLPERHNLVALLMTLGGGHPTAAAGVGDVHRGGRGGGGYGDVQAARDSRLVGRSGMVARADRRPGSHRYRFAESIGRRRRARHGEIRHGGVRAIFSVSPRRQRAGAGGARRAGRYWVAGIEAPSLWGALVVNWIDNLIRPLVINGPTRIPFLLVFLGVLGGLNAFGLIGLFLGLVLLAVSMPFGANGGA